MQKFLFLALSVVCFTACSVTKDTTELGFNLVGEIESWDQNGVEGMPQDGKLYVNVNNEFNYLTFDSTPSDDFIPFPSGLAMPWSAFNYQPVNVCAFINAPEGYSLAPREASIMLDQSNEGYGISDVLYGSLFHDDFLNPGILNFKHVLSKVIVDIYLDTQNLQVILKNVNPSYILKWSPKGVTTSPMFNVADVIMHKSVENEVSFFAILPEQITPDEAVLEVTRGDSLLFSIPIGGIPTLAATSTRLVTIIK